MGRQVNWDDVPDSTILPQNIYEAQIESVTEKQSKQGRLMYQVVYRIVGGAYDGTPLYDYFSIGTEDDPNGDDPETWKASFGVRRMKRMIRAAGVALSSDVDESLMAATGQHLMLTVDQETDDGSRDPKYKGAVRNRIAAVYPMGEREAPAAPAAKAASTPKAAPAATGGAKTAAKVAMAPCGTCKQLIPRNELLKHMQTAHPVDEEE